MINAKIRRSRRSKSKRTKGTSLGKRRKLTLKRGRKLSGKKLGKRTLNRRPLKRKRRINKRRRSVKRTRTTPALLPFVGDPSPAYQNAYSEAYQHGFNTGFNQGIEDGHKLAYQGRI